MTSQNKGFTLIEMLIVVLLLSIIVGISVPSYRSYVLRAGRVDAANSLMRIAAAQERFYLNQGTYASNAQMPLVPPAGLGFTTSQSERSYYDLAITSADLTRGYNATAKVAGGSNQAGDPDCTAFSLDQNGRRGANGGYIAATVEKCWR